MLDLIQATTPFMDPFPLTVSWIIIRFWPHDKQIRLSPCHLNKCLVAVSTPRWRRLLSGFHNFTCNWSIVSHFKNLGPAAASSSLCFADVFSEENKSPQRRRCARHIRRLGGPVDKTLVSPEKICELHSEEPSVGEKPEIIQGYLKSPFMIFYNA